MGHTSCHASASRVSNAEGMLQGVFHKMQNLMITTTTMKRTTDNHNNNNSNNNNNDTDDNDDDDDNRHTDLQAMSRHHQNCCRPACALQTCQTGQVCLRTCPSLRTCLSHAWLCLRKKARQRTCTHRCKLVAAQLVLKDLSCHALDGHNGMDKFWWHSCASTCCTLISQLACRVNKHHKSG